MVIRFLVVILASTRLVPMLDVLHEVVLLSSLVVHAGTVARLATGPINAGKKSRSSMEEIV